MHNSNESRVNASKLVLIQNGACFKSPTSHSTDQGHETPQKLPTAPHPSPINMEIESSNPKSNEVFRTELLKACQLKIPEAIAKAANYDDYVQTKLSYNEEDSMSNLEDVPYKQTLISHHKKSKLEEGVGCCREEEISNNHEPSHDHQFRQSFKAFNGQDGSSNHDVLANGEVCSSDFKHRSNHAEGQSECPLITYSNESHLEFPNGSKSECSTLPKSPNFRNQFEARSPILNVNLFDTINKKDGTDRSVYYDHTTDHLEISRLLNANSGWQENSICRSRSPCSDKMSTVANCSSDASDISDDLMDRDKSMDFEETQESQERRPKKQQQPKSSAMRRFLSWRKCLKLRKRTASLDESRFPFLANRFDSYKTEFELSV